jgi:hypothetical protein
VLGFFSSFPSHHCGAAGRLDALLLRRSTLSCLFSSLFFRWVFPPRSRAACTCPGFLRGGVGVGALLVFLSGKKVFIFFLDRCLYCRTTFDIGWGADLR